MKRRVFGQLLLIAVVLIFMACSNKTTTAEKSKIVFWHWWAGHEETFLRTIADEYTAKIGAQVELMQIKDYATVLTAISGGTPPDAIMVTAKDQLAELVNSGATYPLDDLIMRDKIDTGIFLDSAINSYKFNGKLHGLPFMGFNDGLFWNKTLFKEAGLDPETPPKTSEEMLEFSRKLTKVDASGNIIQLGFIPNWPFEHLTGANSSYIRMFDGQLFDEVSGKYTTTNEGIVKVLEWMRSFYHGLDPQKVANFVNSAGAYLTPEDLFQTGKVAMAIDGCWSVRFIEADIDYGTYTVPVSKNNFYLSGLTTIDYNPHFIPAGSKNIEGAWDFFKFIIMDPEITARFADASANLSQLKKVPTQFTSDLFTNKNYLVFVNAANGPNCVVQKIHPLYNEISTKLFTVQETILRDPNSDIKALLKQVGDEINAQL